MVEANPARQQARDELAALAQQHIDNWDSYASREFVSEELGFRFTSRQCDVNGLIMTVSKATVPGLTLEQHRFFRENLITQIPKMDDKISCIDCPDVDGLRCVIQQIKMPMIMSNRSIPQLYYTQENEDGTLVFMASSKGTEGVVAAQAGVIKKNVVANNIINYTKLTPTADGCEWVSVQCMDIAGSIPDAMKRQGAERQAKNAMFMIKLIKDRDL